MAQSGLKDGSMESFCEYLQSEKCSKIIVMTGAGISTSAGIPDFRTPGTGLYDNLQKYELPYPEAIFDIEYFKRKPEPFYHLSRELFPGKFNPTPCHYFIKLLADEGLLLRNYTQQIDMLERLAGIPEDLLVEAHGSFNDARCVGYSIKRTEVKQKYMKDRVEVTNTTVVTSIGKDALIDKLQKATENESDENTTAIEALFQKLEVNDPPSYESPDLSSDDDDDYEHFIGCSKKYTITEFKSMLTEGTPKCDCKGLVKPEIVFFGEQLPKRFHEKCHVDFDDCDALIVIGTSLQVAPFCNLIEFVSNKVPRLLINREVCGVFDPERGLGFDFEGANQTYRRDALYLGNCDDGIKEFCRLMGWEDSLDQLINNKRAI